jgi:hypothetical protein
MGEKVTKCLNCGTEFEGKYCPECGQSADTKRFTVRFIFENLLRAILSNDGGVWITLKSLFIRPGQMMLDIIHGKRKSYFSPFPMLFLTLSLYVVIFTFTGSKKNDFEGLVDDSPTEQAIDTTNMTQEQIESQLMINKAEVLVSDIRKMYSKHYTSFFILTIPVYLLSARVVYGRKNRKKYNWGEYSIPIVYSLILLILFKCLVSIAYYFSSEVADVINNFTVIINIIAFTACFKKMVEFSTLKTAWRSFLLIVFYWTFFITLAVVAVILAALIYSLF